MAAGHTPEPDHERESDERAVGARSSRDAWLSYSPWIAGTLLGVASTAWAVSTGAESWTVAWIRMPACVLLVIIHVAFASWIPSATARVRWVIGLLSLGIGARSTVHFVSTQEPLLNSILGGAYIALLLFLFIGWWIHAGIESALNAWKTNRGKWTLVVCCTILGGGSLVALDKHPWHQTLPLSALNTTIGYALLTKVRSTPDLWPELLKKAVTLAALLAATAYCSAQ